MILRITITYFDGRNQDVVNHAGLTPETARARGIDILRKIQECIEKNALFYAGDGDNMIAMGPRLLASAHFKCEIVEEDVSR